MAKGLLPSGSLRSDPAADNARHNTLESLKVYPRIASTALIDPSLFAIVAIGNYVRFPKGDCRKSVGCRSEFGERNGNTKVIPWFCPSFASCLLLSSNRINPSTTPTAGSLKTYENCSVHMVSGMLLLKQSLKIVHTEASGALSHLAT